MKFRYTYLVYLLAVPSLLMMGCTSPVLDDHAKAPTRGLASGDATDIAIDSPLRLTNQWGGKNMNYQMISYFKRVSDSKAISLAEGDLKDASCKVSASGKRPGDWFEFGLGIKQTSIASSDPWSGTRFGFTITQLPLEEGVITESNVNGHLHKLEYKNGKLISLYKHRKPNNVDEIEFSQTEVEISPNLDIVKSVTHFRAHGPENQKTENMALDEALSCRPTTF